MADGKQIACKKGYDEYRKEYNDKKQAVKTVYYLNGQPTILPEGYAIVQRAYDEKDLITSESYYGAAEEPVLCTSGYHRIEKTWLDKDHVISQTWYDENDTPIAVGNTFCRLVRRSNLREICELSAFVA